MILACPAWAAAELAVVVGRTAGRTAQRDSLHVFGHRRHVLTTPPTFDGRRAGHGFLVPRVERRRMAACTFVDAKFDLRAPADRILLRCFFGGAGDDRVLDESDETLAGMAREELRTILGLTAAPLFTSISRWPAIDGAIYGGPRGALEGNSSASRRDSRPVPGRQRLHRHRHPGLHPHGPRRRARASWQVRSYNCHSSRRGRSAGVNSCTYKSVACLALAYGIHPVAAFHSSGPARFAGPHGLGPRSRDQLSHAARDCAKLIFV